MCWGPLHSVHLGESDALVSELHDLSTSQLGVRQNRGFDDLDRLGTSTVSSTHLEVELGDSTAESHVMVLFVHVDGAGPGVIAQEDAKVLHAAGLLLLDLAGVNDLSLYAADLMLTLHVVPELGPGEDGVTGENAHSEELGVSLFLSWEGSSDDVELSNLNASQNCYDTAPGRKND